MAHDLTLYTSTPLNQALNLPISVAEQFFNGPAFHDWQRGRDAENKTQAVIVDCLNNITRSNGHVVKAIQSLWSRGRRS